MTSTAQRMERFPNATCDAGNYSPAAETPPPLLARIPKLGRDIFNIARKPQAFAWSGRAVAQIFSPPYKGGVAQQGRGGLIQFSYRYRQNIT